MWEYYPMTVKGFGSAGSIETAGYGVLACSEKYAIYAEREVELSSGVAFYGLYGFGDTEEDAMSNAKKLTEEFDMAINQ